MPVMIKASGNTRSKYQRKEHSEVGLSASATLHDGNGNYKKFNVFLKVPADSAPADIEAAFVYVRKFVTDNLDELVNEQLADSSYLEVSAPDEDEFVDDDL